MIDWFAQYHFLFVHFPIALIIAAAIAEAVMMVRKDAPLGQTVNFLIILAIIFLLPTIASGLALEATGEGSETLEIHETLAFTTLALAVMTMGLRYRYGRRLFYFIGLGLLVVSVIATAHFGGLMAFGPMSYLPPLQHVWTK